MIDIRPAEARRSTVTDWLDSRHSFAFGEHYDPANTGFGLLVASNDDVLAPGAAFEQHPHRDLEIVTWVLDGTLRHEDDHGNEALVGAGQVQRLSAGSGVVHREANASNEEPLRLVQMWVLPDELGGVPAYAQGVVDIRYGLVPVVSGRGHDAITLRQRDAVLWAGRVSADDRVPLPVAPLVHVYVARGEGVLDGAGPLEEGDAVRLRDEQLAFRGDAELLVWEMHSPRG